MTVVHKWYARPVFFVADIKRAERFYCDLLGFVRKWPADGEEWIVCQVDRSECEIILCQDETRRDKGRLFIELTPEGVAEIRREVVERDVPHTFSWWGYDVLQIDDPDGNELLIPLNP
jgi:catechol 2,3-dioxygenase-like lactoylglutathione lyase family enzyme